MSIFCSKNALFGYFWARIWENYFHIWNQHLQICQIVKFFGKIIMSKFATKNALFLWWNLTTISSYLKSATSNLSNWKISWINKNTKIWEWNCLTLVLKMSYLCIFGLEFGKTTIIYETSTFEFENSITIFEISTFEFV